MNERAQTKKYVLFVGKIVWIQHPRIFVPGCGTNYALCFISDPYQDGETIDGWVQTSWLEPLTESPTYEHEARQHVLEVFQRQTKEAKGR